MTNAAVYVRISQDREGAGLGVQRQKDDCRQLAENLGFRVGDVYCDNDASAYSGKPRPEYQRLLGDIKSGVVEAVIVWHTDRLHRSTLELESYIEVAGSIPTYTVKSGLLDLSTPSGRMTARITGAVARHESEHKSERQRRKADELAAKGLPLGGGRPFGYEANGCDVRTSEAAEVREMVRKVLAGDSLGSILRDLNDRGVLTTRGGTWGYTSLREILLRERNCGRMVHRGEIVGRASWAPLVSETDHDAVGAMLADPARRTTTGSARKHLLSGLLRCGTCDAKMKAGSVRSRGVRYELYRCPTRGTGHVHRSREKVEKYVVSRVLDQLSAVLITSDEADTSALEQERDELRSRQDEMAVMYAEGKITGSQLAAITARTRERIEAISGDLSHAAAEDPLDGAQHLSAADWETLSLDRRRRIIDSLMEVTVMPVKHGPLPHDAGVAIKLRSDTTPGVRTTTFGFRMPTETATRVRAATR